MRLDDLDPTQHARDLGSGGGGGGGFGLLGFLPLLLGRGMGCGGIVLIGIVALIYFAMSGGGGMLGSTGGSSTGPASTTAGASGAAACNTAERRFPCQVMTSTEQTWDALFKRSGQTYQPPTINFYQRGVQSGCGQASSAVGPFYCPADDGIYLDTTFFDELGQRYGAEGDFAQAYVIAHEVGHHIQKLLGTSEEVSQAQARASRSEGNRLSVLLELQADCFAGVWAGNNRDRLEPGDIEEGMTAANAIGDDTLQKQAQGEVVPDSFTHGTSAQRMEWLRKGLESGDPAVCNTFAATR
ncbi:KPN_02809 family neutral zinc metallopeptidase [Sphingomonas sp. M1-B02]|uniref:KPN_02809 family neutral zinc metallopeptidase n=1 Tax=Sphingomonas sp. M1-B02 TaxID=3114300 RepID=UPI00223F9CE9|nr:neutral zinc metallopeptidase [Sphingomonas sp. S6-11]UZK65850.1 neutral zinc metallopeptidase [Sphingomonas sp. S6-11]